jgi:hypothetical protein
MAAGRKPSAKNIVTPFAALALVVVALLLGYRFLATPATLTESSSGFQLRAVAPLVSFVGPLPDGVRVLRYSRIEHFNDQTEAWELQVSGAAALAALLRQLSLRPPEASAQIATPATGGLPAWVGEWLAAWLAEQNSTQSSGEARRHVDDETRCRRLNSPPVCNPSQHLLSGPNGRVLLLHVYVS